MCSTAPPSARPRPDPVSTTDHPATRRVASAALFLYPEEASMPTRRFRPPRSAGRTESVTELMQLQRWLDDGGAEASDPHRPPPVMRSPVALSARLEAERSLEALGRRSWTICVRARAEINRVVAAVGRRQVSLSAATAQLRRLTERLDLPRLAEDSRREPPEWQLLRELMPETREPARHRVLHAALGTTNGRGMSHAH